MPMRMDGVRAGRPEAAALIWRWREDAGAREGSPASHRSVRVRGGLQAVVGVALGAAIFASWSAWVGSAVMTLSALIGIAALASPDGAYRALQRLFAATGRVAGGALTWLLLVPLFYLFFWPFGRLLRRGRRDRMRRYAEPEAESYWEPHEGPTSGSPSHLRQY